jgi:ATP-dependent Zn protease
MVNEALAVAIRDGRDTIEWPDMIKAKHLKEHGLPDDTEYIERERHAVAINEACHAVVAYRLRKHALIDMATIERRGDIGGFVSFIPPEDIFVNWKSEYDTDIMCSLASLAGERLFFDDDNSAGVAGDLAQATAVAARMEAYLGMGRTVASHRVTKFGLTRGRAQHASEDGTDRNLLETELGRRVETHLEELLVQTEELLRENRSEILAVTHALETHKTMSGDDVAAIIEGLEGPLVDGRPYREAAFVDDAERYHVEAVAAHKAHSKPTIDMPALRPFAPTLNGEVAGLPTDDGEPGRPPLKGPIAGGDTPDEATDP